MDEIIAVIINIFKKGHYIIYKISQKNRYFDMRESFSNKTTPHTRYALNFTLKTAVRRLRSVAPAPCSS